MKRLFAVALLALSSIAFGATLVPVPLLNPAGSTAGQAILSTGPTTPPTFGNVGLNGIAAIGANTVLGNSTASSASPTAITVTGCNGAAQALQWTNGTGFGCNSAVATSGANSNITGLSGLTSAVALPGVTNGGAAAAGKVGEVITNTATGVSLTSGTAANCTSISLTAGDWDVWGNVGFSPALTTVQTSLFASVNTTSATQAGPPNQAVIQITFPTGVGESLAAPMRVFNVSSTTTVFLVATSTFTTSTETATCIINARRRH